MAKIRAEREAAKATGGEGASVASVNELTNILANGRRIVGMDDGVIFPPEKYDQPTSVMAQSAAALERAPLRGTLRVICILAEFADVKLAAGAKQRMTDIFFSTGKISTGSVTEYYREVSNGKISLTGEVVGPVTLRQTMGYYSNNQYGRGTSEPNVQTMASEAFEAARNAVNWLPYDNDGNGYVDAYIIIHAGQAADAEQKPQNIWSVKWVMPQVKQQSGVNIYGFLTVSEFAKIGVCAHELGHLLFGWPDLYDIDDSASGIGNWCLMAAGSWGGGGDRPVHPSAWCKANQGWIDTVTETDNHSITLQDVKLGFKTHRLWTNGDTSSKEYFLLENRQLTGYDASLPGGGLIIWHIDDTMTANNDENHPWVKIMEADGQAQLKTAWYNGDAGDPYPGTARNTTFNASTNPHSRSYAGSDTYVSVTNIPASAASMTFNITVKPVGGVTPPTTTPTDFDYKVWYRLKNGYQTASYSLDVLLDNGTNSTGKLQLNRDANVNTQYWQIKSNGDGTYGIRNLYFGSGRRLDVATADKTMPMLYTYGNYTGQYWIIKPWGDGTWHLENYYSGPYAYLDTYDNSTQVALLQSNNARPTQRWTITKIRDMTQAELA